MDIELLIYCITVIVSALGVKEIWGIWKRKIEIRNKKDQIDEITKDRFTSQVIEELKRKIFLDYNVHVGIIIVDSRLMPSRVGTIGIAVACTGFEPVKDLRGEKDLDGNPLKVTFQATADNLASIANHKMGECSESQPIAIIRDSECQLTSRKISHHEMAISDEQCLYVRGLSDQLD